MNKVNIVIIAVIVILLAGGGFFIYSATQKKSSNVQTTAVAEEQPTIKTMNPEDIGLKMVMSLNNHRVRVIADKVSGVKSLEYEITYDADIPSIELIEGGETRTTRGFNGEKVLDAGQDKYESKDFDLGSCSKNVCRYDTGVEQLDIVMKVTMKDGRLYQVKDSLKLE